MTSRSTAARTVGDLDARGRLARIELPQREVAVCEELDLRRAGRRGTSQERRGGAAAHNQKEVTRNRRAGATVGWPSLDRDE